MADVTRILSAIEQGDSQAAEQLLPMIYEELRRLAAEKMAQEKPGQTLQATALVHEAYIRLVDVEKGQHWDSRGHFFAAAGEAMRRVLVESARQKNRHKRGGGMQRQAPDDIAVECGFPLHDLLIVDEALGRLEKEDPQAAQVVKLRFFAGLNHEEVGQALGVSAVTARRHWRYARVWLHREIRDR
jgi:RNA polymerase sigma factor (TIGR02999 family)